MPDIDPITAALATARPRDLDWLLADLLPKILGSKAALLLTSDGLPKAAAGLDDAGAQHLSSVAAGMLSLARTASKNLEEGAPGVRQLMAELDDMLMFVRAAGANTVLAVFTGREADVAHVGLEMTQLVTSVEAHLETPQRPSAAGTGESMV